MIEGLHFNSQEIKDLEQHSADAYFESNDPRFHDALTYYSPLFEDYLINHANKHFVDLPEKEQRDVLEEEHRRFVYSMTYSFSKGHMDCYSLILPDFEQRIKFKKAFFEDPSNKTDFLSKVFSALPDDTYQRKINKDRVYSLVQYTRSNFENCRYYIMYLAKMFYMKGADVAYDQITTDIVKTKPKITGYTKILHLPYNQEISITPAFTATFDTEHLNTESWDISWDISHGAKAQSNLVGKLILNRFTRQEIDAYAGVDAITYIAIRDFFQSQSDDADPNDVLYQAQMIFALPSDVKNYKPIKPVEYQQIMRSLRDTICRSLGIKNNQILIRI